MPGFALCGASIQILTLAIRDTGYIRYMTLMRGVEDLGLHRLAGRYTLMTPPIAQAETEYRGNHQEPAVEWFRLSSRQLPIWLELQISGENTSYQVGGYSGFAAAVEPDILRRSIAETAARHEILQFWIDRDEPRQRLATRLDVPLVVLDVADQSDPEAALMAFVKERFRQGLPLGEVPLWEVVLARAGPDLSFFVIRLHHLIADGLSVELMCRDIWAAYDRLAGGLGGGILPAGGYRDFLATDLAYQNSTRYSADLAYWRARFTTLPPALLLTSRDRIDIDPEPAGLQDPVAWQPDPEFVQQFRSQCTAAEITPLSALLAVLAAVLRPPGDGEPVIGVAVPGRRKADFLKMGQFANILSLRCSRDDSTTLAASAHAIERQLAQDYRHQALPVDALARALKLQGRRAVYDVQVSYMPAHKSGYTFSVAGASITPKFLRSSESAPLGIYIHEHADTGLRFEFSWNPRHLDRSRVATIVCAFTTALETFVAKPDTIASEISRPALPERQPSPSIAPYRFRIAATFTADAVVAPLMHWMDRLSVPARCEMSGYAQVFQALLDPENALQKDVQGCTIILLRIEDWLRDRPQRDGAPAEGDAAFVLETADALTRALATHCRLAPTATILAIMPPTPRFDRHGPGAELQMQAENLLAMACDECPGLELLRHQQLSALYPVSQFHDPDADRLGHVPYTDAGFVAIASAVARRIHRRLRRPVKIIAVDCDETLWSGIVAEDGIDNLRLDASHRALQRRLVEASEAGVLVCLVSKNDVSDVERVFSTRRDMALELRHVAAMRINWQPKPANLADLAAQFGLGSDSIVFIDDNPVEIAEVRAALPEICAVAIPSTEPERYRFIEHFWPLDVGRATSEDANRVVMYRQNALRDRAAQASSTLAEFHHGLQLVVEIGAPCEGDMPRCMQLSERTTQFANMPVRRGSAARLANEEAAGGFVRVVRVSDRFGAYGLVGLITGRRLGATLHIDGFLLSCRVLGRGVEHRIVARLGADAIALGCDTIEIAAAATDRNLPFRQFLADIAQLRDLGGEGLRGSIAAEDAAALRFDAAASHKTPAPPPADGRSWRDDRFVATIAAERWAEIATGHNTVAAIQRELHAAHAPGSMDGDHQSPRSSTERLLAGLVGNALGVDGLSVNSDFIALGLQSLAAVQIAARIRLELQCTLAVRALFEARTVARLAAIVEAETASAAYSALTPLQLGRGGRTPLFCFHPSGGDAICYLRLARSLGDDVPVYGLQASGLLGDEAMADSVGAMAGAYLNEIRRRQPKGPYLLLGWSFGGALAYETACLLRMTGETVALLALMDAPTPDEAEETEDPSLQECLRAIGEDLPNLVAEFGLDSAAGDTRPVETIDDLMRAARRLQMVPEDFSGEDAERKIEVYRNCTRAFKMWKPRGCDAPILHFRASQPRWGSETEFGWDRWATRAIETVWIDCTHLRMGFEPFVDVISARIRPILDRSG